MYFFTFYFSIQKKQKHLLAQQKQRHVLEAFASFAYLLRLASFSIA